MVLKETTTDYVQTKIKTNKEKHILTILMEQYVQRCNSIPSNIANSPATAPKMLTPIPCSRNCQVRSVGLSCRCSTLLFILGKSEVEPQGMEILNGKLLRVLALRNANHVMIFGCHFQTQVKRFVKIN